MRTAEDVNAVAEDGFAFRLAKIGLLRATDYESTNNNRKYSYIDCRLVLLFQSFSAVATIPIVCS
jgi:hypothetical protein